MSSDAPLGGQAALTGIGIRQFANDDIPQVLQLMKELAKFEHYIDGFAVTEEALRQGGKGPAPQFSIFVAHFIETPAELLGIAVCYTIPFSFDLTPEVVLKELFVRQEFRHYGIGRRLMREVIRYARQLGCVRLRWLVLAGNETARKFYSSLAAKQDTKWENWQLLIENE